MISVTPQQQADLLDPRVTKAAVWFVKLDLFGSPILFSDQSEELLYKGDTYEAQAGKWKVPGEISTGSGLTPERLDFQFDGADRYVGGSLFARILAGDWHLSTFELALALYNADSGDFLLEVRKVFGFVDQLKNPEATDAEPWAIMSCETGSFRMMATRSTQCSDMDQRRRSATDGFMKYAGVAGSINIPFGIASQDVPGYSSSSTGDGGSGGGSGFERFL